MLKKFLNIFCLASLIIFLFLITNYYFSEQNIIFTNKSRSKYSVSLTADNKNLPLLQNDTEDVIVYKNDLEEFKNKRKKRIWEKLISD
tara:strand:- start:229 stop:492 length:264 start_codon:yes stop_codon:yes gene_type:complete